jgi:hypothetical protein
MWRCKTANPAWRSETFDSFSSHKTAARARRCGADLRPQRVHYFWHYAGNKFLTLLSDIFTNLKLTDMETCYKVFRREVLQNIKLKSDRFGFEPEITAKISKGTWRIYEVSISYAGRTYAEGKKITWRDGISTLWCIIRFNLFN